MKKITSAVLIIAIGCILTGCRSAESAAASDRLPKTIDATYHITLVREVLVGLNDSDSNEAIPHKQTETLELVCRVHSSPGVVDGYRVTFEKVTVQRTDFLHQLSVTDPAGELAGQSFDVRVDSDGRIIKADAMEKSFKALAQNCTTCPQGHGCGQRKVREQTFLLDVWSVQELLFRVSRTSQNMAESNKWQYQLPSVLPGQAPFVTTEWEIDRSRPDMLIANGFETLGMETAKDSLPVLFHPHVRPKGFLGYLRNCTYDSIEGNILLTLQADSGFPLQMTRETAMNASAIYALSRQHQKANITVWETTKITRL